MARELELLEEFDEASFREVVTPAEKVLPKVRIRQVVPYTARAHTASWQLVHALAGLASHAAWHVIPQEMTVEFTKIKEKRREILKDWYARVKKGLKASKPIFEIIEEIVSDYEKLTGEPIAKAREHIPKAVMKLERIFGIKIEVR
jgi:hypothetical protein